MREQSLQFRFLVTVLSAILIITVFVGGLSIYEVDNYIQKETQNLVRVTCENEADKINYTFNGMEKSVRIMENYMLSFFESAADVKDPSKQNEALQFADEMFVNVAKDTEGAIAYYLRLNPEISNSTAGIFYSKVAGGDEYVRFDPTDIAIYDKNDTEHVGWYWQPYEAGKPIWMAPYYNQNNNILMISYVVPLYYEDLFIGVVGMDFGYTVLTEIVQSIKIYENGFAHLELDNAVIHDGNYSTHGPSSHKDPQEYLRVSEVLTNGMTLVLSASYDDIRQIRYDIGLKILFIVLLFALVFSLFVVIMVKKIVKPLKELTSASTRLAKGDYDVEIAHSNIREINLLNTTFENMIMNLREHKKLQHDLAHRDPLTGLRNTTSYKSWVAEFDNKIKGGETSFGVTVLDINYLKTINDTHGHTLGNELISTAARIISDTFKRSPVFRIGGDEFCVILQNRDLEDIKKLFESFDSECATSYVNIGDGNTKFPISIAKGFAQFDPAKDTQFLDVFERADTEMYKNKRLMKKEEN
jgi:diguanylate cyclase (GGDEF)-like protein